DEDEPAVLAAERLVPTLGVDDREASHPEPDRAVAVDAAAVRAPVLERVDHPHEHLAVDRAPVRHDAGDPAHQRTAFHRTSCPPRAARTRPPAVAATPSVSSRAVRATTRPRP